MKSLSLFAAAVAAVCAQTDIILPLYEYPLGDAAAADWSASIAAAKATPNLNWIVIVNVNSGPVFSPNPPAAIIDFSAFLGQWNALANVKLIGYIATSYGAKTITELETGVDQYAAWTRTNDWGGVSQDIKLDGIFFDEIDTATGQLDHNLEISRYAKSKFSGPVVLNPGTTVQAGSESLFDVADYIMTIEACYTSSPGRVDFNGFACDPSQPGFAAFTPATLDRLGSNATQLAKSAVLVHDFYEQWSPYVTASEATLKTDVEAIVSKGIGAFYISQLGYNSNFTAAEPATVGKVAQLAAAAQGL